MKTQEIKTWDELNASYKENEVMSKQTQLLRKLIAQFQDLAPNSTDLEVSTFNNIQRVHDWRNYIPDELREVWAELSTEAKLACAFMAQTQADNEVWE